MKSGILACVLTAACLLAAPVLAASGSGKPVNPVTGEGAPRQPAGALIPNFESANLLSFISIRIQMREHLFPDGSGSIDLPNGWTTPSQSVVGGIEVDGPAGQKLSIGQGIEVATPDSIAVQWHQQLVAQAAQFDQQAPAFTMCVAPYTGPVDALRNLVPQISEFSRRAGGPGVRLDRIMDSTDAPCGFPNGKAALIHFAFTKLEHGVGSRHRAFARIETYAIGQGAWGVYFTELAAPDASFDTDLPTMLAISQSLKCNDRVVADITQNAIQASNERFAAFEHSIREENEAFDRYERSVRHDELVRERSNEEFNAIIRGDYRGYEERHLRDDDYPPSCGN